jgi:hypothetical protein
LHADEGGALGAGRSLAAGGEGCAGSGAAGGAVGAISALRLSAAPDLPRARRPGDERGPRIGCGGVPACSFRAGGRASAWRAAGLGQRHRAAPTRSGRSTSCSTPAPMAASSSA